MPLVTQPTNVTDPSRHCSSKLLKRYPALVDQLAQQGKCLPEHVHREFDDYLKCGRLEHGFLRVRCDSCHFERLTWAAPCLQLQASRICEANEYAE